MNRLWDKFTGTEKQQSLKNKQLGNNGPQLSKDIPLNQQYHPNSSNNSSFQNYFQSSQNIQHFSGFNPGVNNGFGMDDVDLLMFQQQQHQQQQQQGLGQSANVHRSDPFQQMNQQKSYNAPSYNQNQKWSQSLQSRNESVDFLSQDMMASELLQGEYGSGLFGEDGDVNKSGSFLNFKDYRMKPFATGQQHDERYRKLWQQILAVNKGSNIPENLRQGREPITVEIMLKVIQNIPKNESTVPIIQNGLLQIDSSALAALLKELYQTGFQNRSLEIFNWLRSLPEADERYKLCDVYTYTTMISQCSTVQELQRALEMVVEMRFRGIQCNVRTYSALISVCLKAKQLQLALDVYEQMINEGIQPSLVTYNTLIDVYAKVGQWSKAVDLLDNMQQQGIQPEARTYNQLISACCKLGKPEEARKVYQRMLNTGTQPSALTYTLLINAYGKNKQLSQALEFYNDMEKQGCERNVITYSCLINACDKAGQWKLALQLFEDMKKNNIVPNVITYNSLITAYAQGNLWEQAWQTFQEMPLQGCEPDKISFAAIVLALQKGKQWRLVLLVYHMAKTKHVVIDKIMLNLLIDSLWSSGVVSAQKRAYQLFMESQKEISLTFHVQATAKEIHYKSQVISSYSAVIIFYRWLHEQRSKLSTPQSTFGGDFVIIFQYKQQRNRLQYTLESLYSLLDTLIQGNRLPMRSWPTSEAVEIQGSFSVLAQWFQGAGGALMDLHLQRNNLPVLVDSVLIEQDDLVEQKCKENLDQLVTFEKVWVVDEDTRKSWDQDKIGRRSKIIQILRDYQTTFQFSLDLMYSTVPVIDLLLTKADSTLQKYSDSLSLFVAASISIAAQQPRSNSQYLQVTSHFQQNFGSSTFNNYVEEASQALQIPHPGKGYLIATPLQALSIYLDRLHDNYLHDPQNQALDPAHSTYIMALLSSLDKCINSAQLMSYSSSIVGASIVFCIREAFGMVPYWPHALENLTGITLVKEDQYSSVSMCIKEFKKLMNMDGEERGGGSKLGAGLGGVMSQKTGILADQRRYSGSVLSSTSSKNNSPSSVFNQSNANGGIYKHF